MASKNNVQSAPLGAPQAPFQSTRGRIPDPGVPHPSWRRTLGGGDAGAGRIVNAGDFWARLGI